MEVLLVSPTRPILIIVAKAVPYMVLSLLILVSILLISFFILQVPIAGSLGAIFAVSLLYILLSLSLGLLISVVAETQMTAMLISGMILLMPSMLLSGMIYPIESMPEILQWLSAVVPARWYTSAMRKLMIMGVDVSMIREEVAVMGGMTALLLTVALLKFKKRLDS
jgi:ABC-2 type transport system permease protein